MSIPDTMKQDAFELDGQAEVHLFKLEMTDGTVVRMVGKGEYVWLGEFYEEIPCHMTAFRRQADGEVSRPKFSFVNPEHLFTSAVQTGILEMATITRFRILKSDLDANNDAALAHTFTISRVVSVNRERITCECRGVLDGPGFKLPFRAFYPPEFPYVKVR